MLYTAKCFWPGARSADVLAAAARASAAEADAATYRGALHLPGDEIVLCLFEATAPAAVKRASEGAGIPCERVIETVWIPPEGGSTCVLRSS